MKVPTKVQIEIDLGNQESDISEDKLHKIILEKQLKYFTILDYEQDDTLAHNDAMQKISDEVSKVLTNNSELIYDAYTHNEATDMPINNLHESPFQGDVVLVHEKDSEGKMYQSDLLKSPTWLDICVEADKAMKLVGDLGHPFLEGVHPIKGENGVITAEMNFGS